MVTTRPTSETMDGDVTPKLSLENARRSAKASRVSVAFFILLFTVNLFAQFETKLADWKVAILNEEGFSKVEQKDRISKYNFAPLWTQTENSSVFG
ncbi:MAG: hypothetical protein QUS14_01540, partial [Pyrinomonadaceae bacterium]|nr:hypothetical protein [Pyrinomonadaceae bacterium]